MNENESSLLRLRQRLFPCETPGCSGNCAYAWSCHNARVLGRGGYFWPGIVLAAITLGIIILQ